MKPLVPPFEEQLKSLGFEGERAWLDPDAAKQRMQRSRMGRQQSNASAASAASYATGSSGAVGQGPDSHGERPAWRLCVGDGSVFARNPRLRQRDRQKDHDEAVKDAAAVEHVANRARG